MNNITTQYVTWLLHYFQTSSNQSFLEQVIHKGLALTTLNEALIKLFTIQFYSSLSCISISIKMIICFSAECLVSFYRHYLNWSWWLEWRQCVLSDQLLIYTRDCWFLSVIVYTVVMLVPQRVDFGFHWQIKRSSFLIKRILKMIKTRTWNLKRLNR